MLTSLDLFAGAGGFSLGMQKSGIKVVAAVEHDRFAALTYKANHFSSVLHERDILTISDFEIAQMFGGVDIIFGGPPCQGFSVAGPAQYGLTDSRNELLFEFLRFARIIKPQFIVVENVKGVLNGRIGSRRGALTLLGEALKEVGYTYQIKRVMASKWGVPQRRERVFLLCRKHGKFLTTLLDVPPCIPQVSAWEAMSDLPQIVAGSAQELAYAYRCDPQNSFQRYVREGSESVQNHEPMRHSQRILQRLSAIKAGQSLKDVSSEFGQRKRNSDDIDKTVRYKMNCYRLEPDIPAITLPANFQTIHVHPFLDRMLTAREGARLQGFPDQYVFSGPRTLMSRKLLEREGRSNEIGLSQYNQIGNAVPPPVGMAIGMQILSSLSAERPNVARSA
jgi:DNA (cytosine-5)-methyltransferase 1